ncbi:Protein of unknown function [Variovorax sp. YR634]|uniref:DUF2514 family protein n=1 Tax=Variovorax sp. YR634 TaxID=1884385 RepID=UPI00089A5E2A|nr:DUF2514 family protein [Variovorax sp. YR634]SDX11909.1 Protein of unknown function [Variovorax sp. YR634]
MSFFGKLIPWWVQPLIIALLLAGLLGQRVQVSNAKANVARAKLEFSEWKTIAAENRILADRAQRTEEQRKQAVADKEAQDANSKLVQARADAVIASAAAGKLRDQLAAYIAAVRRASQDPAATARGKGQPGADPLDLLAQLYGRTDEAAGAIGNYADDLAIRGASCERISDALQPPSQ